MKVKYLIKIKITTLLLLCIITPYGRQIWQRIKFGGLAVGQVSYQIKLCQFFFPRYQIKLKIMYSCKHDVLLRNSIFSPSSLYSISCWLATTAANRLDSYTHMQCMFINQ